MATDSEAASVTATATGTAGASSTREKAAAMRTINCRCPPKLRPYHAEYERGLCEKRAKAIKALAPPVPHEPAIAPRGTYFLYGDAHSGRA